ncbi:AAA family ATPase [Thiohalocapsa sp. ML1]|jgi:predicted ATPase|uniref:AAA family ATPase n=1 Tax=Thiohalocapsa sp. ML1 TaxID=1431688 RepID=UPI000731F5D8|nr:ATP-binding protein [Thiohalocapsa sp. ML1]
MLTAFTLENFKSYRKATLPLAPLTVLIGANASGKSNAIEGLQMLSWLAQGQKFSSIRYSVQESERFVRGRLQDIGYRGQKEFAFQCDTDEPGWSKLDIAVAHRFDELHIAQESISGASETYPLYRIVQPSSGRGSDAEVAYNNFKQGPNKPRITCTDQTAIFSQLDSPATFAEKYRRSREEIPKVAKAYQARLANILFLDPAPARMRDYAHPSDLALHGDGSNLSGVIKDLWDADTYAEDLSDLSADDPELFHELVEARQSWARDQILDFIRSLPEQDIAGIDFLTEPRGGVMLRLIETFGGEERACDAALLSDGTLRVLAVAAAMLSAPEGSLVVIEEIDNGVHPSRAHHLLRRIQSIAEARKLRVLLTTHNPALLDALPDVAVPHAVFCYRDPDDGSSRLVRLSDLPDYPELIAQAPLGHLLTTGVLDRFVKHHPGPEERKRRALDWLERMRSVSAPEA